ncbi:MAG: CHAP domain-containing protein [bacterium]
MAGVLLVAAGLLLSPRPAAAINQCGGETHQNSCGSANNICICCSESTDCPGSGLGADHGNCVWWAWEKACRDWGVALSTCHNADTWDQNNLADGYHIDPEPCVDTIFVCEQYTSQCGSTNWGHVGWVRNVFPDGSIEVREQGCCWFYGTRNRTFDAHLASPAMKYIYPPGSTSCNPCDCTVGDTEQRPCSDGCGTEERTCGSDCTWGGWSGCDSIPDCDPGESRSCGVCGLQICLLDCAWSDCDELCDGDGGTVSPDAGPEQLDGGAPSGDGGGSDDPGMTGGCSCRGAPGNPPARGVVGLLVLLFAGLRRRRRRRPDGDRS